MGWKVIFTTTLNLTKIITHFGVFFHPRLYSLWNNEAVKTLVKSVAEHQRASWSSFEIHLHFLVYAFPFGLALIIKKYNDERVFSKEFKIFSHPFSQWYNRIII